MFSLGAAFKALVTVGNAPSQRLVVAGFKVQAVHPLQGAPIPSIRYLGLLAGWRCRTRNGCRLLVEGDQAAGHGLAVTFGHKQQPVFGHRVGHALKKVAAQVRRIAVLQVGAFVAVVEKIPIAGTDVRAQGPAKVHAGIGHLAPFLANFFALFLCQSGQKGLKVGKSGRAVGPVKLHGVAQHQAGLFAGLQVGRA